MKKTGVILALLGLLVVIGLAASAKTAVAQDEFDRHPHLLLLSPEVAVIDGAPHLVGMRRCIDLAGNQTVPLHAHHDQLHFGSAGVSSGGPAGHAVIPAAPFPSPFAEPVPWSNCEEFLQILPFRLP
jgi:hypothetical protein